MDSLRCIMPAGIKRRPSGVSLPKDVIVGEEGWSMECLGDHISSTFSPHKKLAKLKVQMCVFPLMPPPWSFLPPPSVFAFPFPATGCGWWSSDLKANVFCLSPRSKSFAFNLLTGLAFILFGAFIFNFAWLCVIHPFIAASPLPTRDCLPVWPSRPLKLAIAS